MSHKVVPSDEPVQEAFQQYVKELEPLVAEKAPQARLPDQSRVFLGHLAELAPSRPQSADQLTEADQLWLRALERVAHDHGVDYELVTHEEGENLLWLVPAH